MPNTVDHRHRDPLTLRVARTLRDTLRDPHAWGEGHSEPQLLDVAKSFPPARVRRALGLGPGCYGNCNQGRTACTMPSVCRGAFMDSEGAVAPTPAEACTELGMADNAAAAERADERSRVQLIAGLVIAVLCVAVAFICNALLAAPV